MSSVPERPRYQAEYWNDEGGRRWIRNMARTDVMLRPLGESLLERAALQSGEWVLDVGCGGGITSARAAELVGPAGKVVGVDISAPILEQARAAFGDVPNLEFLLADAAAMKPGERLFDVVLSRFGVMFFADPVAAFDRLRRCTAPAGRIVFICWRAQEDNPWMARPAAAAFQALPVPPAPPPPDAPGPFAFADRQRIHGILHAAGFRRIDFERLDGRMLLGKPEEAVDFLSHAGPAADPIEKAAPRDAAAAVAAIRAVVKEFESAGGDVFANYSCWMISARPS